jgi:uncharacterized membrane protein YfcA
MHSFLLVIIGLAVGAIGTLVGAGGGFILLPIFLLMYPSLHPSELTGISLAVVFFNALSGSIAYAKQGRIDYKSGVLFTAAAIPGSIIGALATKYASKTVFAPLFGLVLIIIGFFLITKPKRPISEFSAETAQTPRIMVEPDGTTHRLSYSFSLGMSASFLVGFVASFFGIGGGIVHVPIMVRLLDFPVHVATATSHFILAILSLIGTLVHLADGTLTRSGLIEIAYIAPSVVVGAQIGAVLSRIIADRLILQILAGGLIILGGRLLVLHG